jgi:hypothetical protein
MIVATGQEFGGALAEALGLSGRAIHTITVRVKANEAVQVRVTELLLDDATKEVLSVVRRYQLVPVGVPVVGGETFSPRGTDGLSDGQEGSRG